MEACGEADVFPMTSSMIVTFLLGAVLGLRFRFPILVPALLLAVAPIATMDALVGASGLTPITLATMSIVVLQIGYLAGTFSRFTLAAARKPGRRDAQTQQPAGTTGSMADNSIHRS